MKRGYQERWLSINIRFAELCMDARLRPTAKIWKNAWGAGVNVIIKRGDIYYADLSR